MSYFKKKILPTFTKTTWKLCPLQGTISHLFYAYILKKIYFM